MQWLDEWRALSARIAGLLAATDVYGTVAPLADGGLLANVRTKAFGHELKSIHVRLEVFRSAGHDLPEEATRALDEYDPRGWERIVDGGQLAGLVAIALLRGRFEYAIRDSEITARTATELAFAHLCRSIAVDPGLRDRWTAAHDEHENQCERLGAVHLLQHGIWAFKVSATGAATDLVFPEPLEAGLRGIQRTASTLVLTEWKRIRELKDLDAMAAQARRQTAAYTAGVLGSAELKRTRYIILVTRDAVEAPPDEVEGLLTFRHIVIPVNPSVASKQ
jgi:hypothetical protein